MMGLSVICLNGGKSGHVVALALLLLRYSVSVHLSFYGKSPRIGVTGRTGKD